MKDIILGVVLIILMIALWVSFKDPEGYTTIGKIMKEFFTILGLR